MLVCLLALVRSVRISGRSRWPESRSWRRCSVYEHSLVQADDLSRVNAAFFTVNGYVSVLFFVFWAADILLLARYVTSMPADL